MIKLLWVGLSHKPNTPPLDDSTISGRLLSEIEELNGVKGDRTNLVKFAPLDENGKLIYPTTAELNGGVEDLLKEISDGEYNLVFLLGGKVVNTLGKKLKLEFKDMVAFKDGVFYARVEHPSYIMAYHKSAKPDYINKVTIIIKECIKKEN